MNPFISRLALALLLALLSACGRELVSRPKTAGSDLPVELATPAPAPNPSLPLTTASVAAPPTGGFLSEPADRGALPPPPYVPQRILVEASVTNVLFANASAVSTQAEVVVRWQCASPEVEVASLIPAFPCFNPDTWPEAGACSGNAGTQAALTARLTAVGLNGFSVRIYASSYVSIEGASSPNFPIGYRIYCRR